MSLNIEIKILNLSKLLTIHQCGPAPALCEYIKLRRSAAGQSRSLADGY